MPNRRLSNNAAHGPAMRQALEFMTARLDSGTWKPGESLPTTQKLSQLAGVSRDIMRRAISLLKAEGLIHGPVRHRLKPGPDVLVPERIEAPIPWERIRSLVERDIVTGSFGFVGRIPAMKELQTRYGACFRTMRKVLGALERDGHLRPSGRGYALPDAVSHPPRPRILFITCNGHFTQMSALNQEHNRIVNLFESECLRLQMHLEIMEIDFYDSADARRAHSKLTRTDQVAGIILDVWWYLAKNYQRSYLEIIRHLESLKLPVAILDEIGNFEFPLSSMRNPLLQTFSIESRRAGERVAQLLLGLGHRRAAYISGLHYASWSRDRYAGIQSQFERAGLRDKVHLFDADVHEGMLTLFAASGLTDNEVWQVIAASHSTLQTEDLFGRWIHFDKSNPERLFEPGPAYDRLSKNLSGLSGVLKQGFDGSVQSKTIGTILTEANRLAAGIHLGKLFREAAKNPAISAWICATDEIALHALAFLQERIVDVPGRISVVGFDNTPVTSLAHNLTTLDFNAMGFIHQMLGFILRPPKPSGPYRHTTIEVEGIIMERGTTGRARQAESG